jgi:hypothetical protein
MSDYELDDEEKNYQGTEAEKLIMRTLLHRMDDMVKPEDREDEDEDDPDRNEDDEEWYELEALSVDKKYAFDVTLGCGGPGDWFAVDCDEDGSINSITYHYAWSGHAERDLWGGRLDIVKDWIERNALNPFANY